MGSRATRRKREEEDDDMILFFFPTLHLLDSGDGGREKTPRHTSTQTGAERVREVLEGHVMNCLVAYRMEPEVFKSIAEFLRRKNLVCDTRGVRVEEKLAMFMYMLSHNASYEDMQYEFKHSGATIHQHIMLCNYCYSLSATNVFFLIFYLGSHDGVIRWRWNERIFLTLRRIRLV